MSQLLERSHAVSGAVKYRLQPLDCRDACSRAHIAQTDASHRYRRFYVERKRFGCPWERLDDKDYTQGLVAQLSQQRIACLLMSTDMLDVASAMHG